MTEGATPSNESDEDGRARPVLPPSSPRARVSVRESEKVDGGGVPITGEGRHDGDQSPAHARRAWERALMPRQSPGPSPSLSFSFRAAASVSLAPRLPPARALSFLQRSPSLSLPLSLSLARSRRGSAPRSLIPLAPSPRCGDAPGRGSPTERAIQGPSGARCYSFRGAQYLGDRQCK